MNMKSRSLLFFVTGALILAAQETELKDESGNHPQVGVVGERQEAGGLTRNGL